MEYVEVGAKGWPVQLEEEYGELEVAVEEEFHQDIPKVFSLAVSAADVAV